MNSKPTFSSPLQTYLEGLHAQHLPLRDGAVATYIPELAKADPDWFGICLVTTGGHVYEVGSTRQSFTIQSISKPFVYGLALEDNTRAEVLKKVGVEPTGDAFNAISLETGTGRPKNPMINAGAIASAGLVAGRTHEVRWQRVLGMLSTFAGETLTVDEAVYRSESETGHRNRGIGHMLRNFDILTEPPDPVVDQYFKQCSVSVTCRHLGIMAATLANRGINPITGKSAIRGEYIESVLSVMGSCGMYDYAGEWLYRVGMPAKSGVAGGIIAVLPGQFGVGVFSPRLDSRGNSVRGLAVCEDLSRDFDFHLFNNPNEVRSVIRLKFTGRDVASSRVRGAEELRVIEEHGDRVLVYQLQGQLVLSSAEVVVHDVIASEPASEVVVLDLKHVVGINEPACRLLHDLIDLLHSRGKPVVFAQAHRFPHLRRFMKARMLQGFEERFLAFEDSDHALEWCEERLLARHIPSRTDVHGEPMLECPLFAGVGAVDRAAIRALLHRRSFRAGEVLVDIGAPAGEVFFIARGAVSVFVPVAGGGRRRLGAFSAGMAFGEMAMLDRAPRSAQVIADTDVDCDLLRIEDFERLGSTHPQAKITLLHNLALSLSARLRKANREIRALDC